MNSDSKKLFFYAYDMMQRAHAPYSSFQVGVALSTDSGHILGGCNIESVSYGLTICAERVAIFQAIAQGYKNFRQLLLMTNTGAFPCGACRQIIYEFCPNIEIIVATDKGIVKICSIQELMPYAFDSLESENI